MVKAVFCLRFVLCNELLSENAAHRIAVEWDTPAGLRTGVYAPHRYTSSRLNTLAGGRLVPGIHNYARFDVRGTADDFRVRMDSVVASAHVLVDGRIVNDLPEGSVFGSIARVSEFFEAGSLRYSPATREHMFDGLELRTYNWQVEPLEVSEVRSSFFENPVAFPPGSITLDNAPLMCGVDHEWHGLETLCYAGEAAPESTVLHRNSRE